MTPKELWDKLESTDAGIINLQRTELVPKNKILLKSGKQVRSINVDTSGNYYLSVADPAQFCNIDYSLYGTPKHEWVA